MVSRLISQLSCATIRALLRPAALWLLFAAILVFVLFPASVLSEPAAPIPSADTGVAIHTLQPRPDGTTRSSDVPGIGISTVIGPDERWQVTGTTEFPARSVAYVELFFPDGSAGSCTATFIGAKVLLTAAHCLYDPRNGRWVESVDVYPGANGSSLPYGYGTAANVAVPSGWTSSGSEWHDYGVIVLSSTTLGNAVGSLQVGDLSNQTISSSSFQPIINGYPGDKPSRTQWAGSKSAFTRVDDLYLYYAIDTYSGQSGSAVRRSADNVVVGIHAYGGSSHNWGRRMDSTVLNNLLNICSQLGCSINQYVVPTATPTPTTTPTPYPHRVTLPSVHKRN